MIKILVGNKADLQGARTVSRQEAESFAESTGMQYIEASAKTDLNVEWIFTELSKVIKQKFGVVVSSRRASYTQPIRRIEDVNKKNSVRTCC